mmetsp:Transcript_745/g.823  ORF Transcript_745/g.823 Transcript_745/m.823 type:complete len:105 (+) Transcript_745:2-316(+)
MKEAVKVLYPQKSRWVERNKDRSRFSTLLLEHGEKRLQDWAVIAYTAPTLRHSTSNSGHGVSGPLVYPRKNVETTWAAHRCAITRSPRKPSSSSSASSRQKKEK